MSEHIGECRLAGRGEIPVDVAEMDDASRDEINGGVLEVLVEVVVVAVANDGVGDSLGVGDFVVGLPADFRERVVAATLRWQGRRELEDTLTDGVTKACGLLPVLALEVVDEDALPPLAECGDDGGDALAAPAGRKEQDRLRARVEQVMNLLSLRIAPAADVDPICRVEQAELFDVFARCPGRRSVQIHQAVGTLAVADEGEEPVSQIGKEKASGDGCAEGDPEIYANTGADEAAAGEVFPEHQGGEWLVDRRAGKPEERLTYFYGVVKPNSEPFGRRARNESKSKKCAEERADIPAALPARPIGEHVTGRSDSAVLHGMPPANAVYISLLTFATFCEEVRIYPSIRISFTRRLRPNGCYTSRAFDGAQNVRIYIDEAGPFVPPNPPRTLISLVLALIIPTASEEDLFYEFLRLRDTWPNQNIEIKGSRLSELQAAQVVNLALKYEVLVQYIALDANTHTAPLVDEFRNGQADAVTVKITREHKAGLVFDLYQLGEAVRRMPNQLFLQTFATWQLIFNTIREGTLYFVQRVPQELGDICWVIDRKDRTITEMEETWTALVLPLIEREFALNPVSRIVGEDYSYYEARYCISKKTASSETLKHLQWLRSVYGLSDSEGRLITDTKRLLTEQRKFEDSRNCLGLQLADMLATILRRAFNDRLQLPAWKDFGGLLVRHHNPGAGLIQLGPGIEAPVLGHPKRVCKILDSRAKDMLVERLRKE